MRGRVDGRRAGLGGVGKSKRAGGAIAPSAATHGWAAHRLISRCNLPALFQISFSHWAQGSLAQSEYNRNSVTCGQNDGWLRELGRVRCVSIADASIDHAASECSIAITPTVCRLRQGSTRSADP